MKSIRLFLMMLVFNILMIGFVFAQDAVIPAVEAPPVIDGEIDAVWDKLDGYLADSHYFVGSENVSGPEDLSMIWKALHDETNLYFLFYVIDDVLNEDSPQPVDHKDDCVEIFFDTDDGNETVPDSLDDFMLKFEYSSTGISPLGPNTGSFPTFDTTGVVARCDSTEDGYLIETLIPLANLGLDAETYMGFDARVNDDDDGGDRDTQLQWGDIDINDWNSPAALPTVILTSDIIEGIEELAPQNQSYQLDQNYPNPFNPSTTISFDIPELKDGLMSAKVVVYDMLGQKVRTLLNGSVGAGRFEMKWNGTNDLNQVVPSGVYIYQFQSELFNASKKMVLMR